MGLVINEGVWSTGGIVLTVENLRTRRKLTSEPLSIPQILHKLAWDLSRASAEEGSQITT
jgi:hypothetical protein